MNKEDFVLVGKRLRQIREKQNCTQAELANILGITARDLQKIETGNFHRKFHILLNLAHLLEKAMLERWTKHKEFLH